MTVVVLGIDALDPDLADEKKHPHLTLDAHREIDTIKSAQGEPSTHELWPTIITGLKPEDHGLTLEDDGVAWGNRFIEFASTVSDYVCPDPLQTAIGAWLLTNTKTDAFRTPATYYADNGITTVFDDREAKPIGIPNYVVDSESEDREHTLRRSMGNLFKRERDAKGGHVSSNPVAFYEQCLEMVMIRIARARRALRGKQYELVFAYTSGLDLIGHVTYDLPDLQMQAYAELNEFVGEIRDDLDDDDELLVVSDHGLQDGVHTDEAMVAGTSETMVEAIEGVTDVRTTIENELDTSNHRRQRKQREFSKAGAHEVREQLEDLGYM